MTHADHVLLPDLPGTCADCPSPGACKTEGCHGMDGESPWRICYDIDAMHLGRRRAVLRVITAVPRRTRGRIAAARAPHTGTRIRPARPLWPAPTSAAPAAAAPARAARRASSAA